MLAKDNAATVLKTFAPIHCEFCAYFFNHPKHVSTVCTSLRKRGEAPLAAVPRTTKNSTKAAIGSQKRNLT